MPLVVAGTPSLPQPQQLQRAGQEKRGGSRPCSGSGVGSPVGLLPGQPPDQPAEEGQLSDLLAGDQGPPRRKGHCELRGDTMVAPPWTVKGPSEKRETLTRTFKEVKELFHPSLWSVNIN